MNPNTPQGDSGLTYSKETVSAKNSTDSIWYCINKYEDGFLPKPDTFTKMKDLITSVGMCYNQADKTYICTSVRF
jgi:hypothetical protein